MKSVSKRYYFLFLLIVPLFIHCKGHIKNADNTSPDTSIYDIEINSIDGETIALDQWKGKKILFVNVASECGFTPQYEKLQQLHEQYGDQVVLVGCPSNDFGGQEPGSHEEIKQFCERNFGVTFTLTEKITVKGNDKHPLYEWLASEEHNGWNNKQPNWNFCKYLVDESGNLKHFFESGVDPMGDEMLGAIEGVD